MHSTHSFQPSFVCSFFCFIAVYSVFPYTFIIEHNALLIHKGGLRENKPPLVNQQCVVYNFQCNLCDAGYVGYTFSKIKVDLKGQSAVIIMSSHHCIP